MTTKDSSLNIGIDLSRNCGRSINMMAPVVFNVPPVNTGNPPPVGDNPTWDTNATPIGDLIEPLYKVYSKGKRIVINKTKLSFAIILLNISKGELL